MSEWLLLIFILCNTWQWCRFSWLGCGSAGDLLFITVLSSILLHFGSLPTDQVVIVAIATSLSSILFTSTSSAIAHHKNGNVPWNLAPWIMTGVALGALVSGFYGGTTARTSGAFGLYRECCAYRS